MTGESMNMELVMLARQFAEVHIGDGDELGVMARRLFDLTAGQITDSVLNVAAVTRSVLEFASPFSRQLITARVAAQVWLAGRHRQIELWNFDEFGEVFVRNFLIEIYKHDPVAIIPDPGTADWSFGCETGRFDGEESSRSMAIRWYDSIKQNYQQVMKNDQI